MTHPTQHHLDQWLFAPEQLTTPETLFIRTHLEHCRHCRTYMESLRTFNAHLQQHLTGFPTERDEEKAEKIHRALGNVAPTRTLYKIAAVIACAALAGVGYYLIFDGNHTHKKTGQVKPQEKLINYPYQNPASTEHSIADNFIPSPHMDDLVHTQFRSVSITVLAPTINEVVTTPISFRWNGHHEPLRLNILTNKEKKIFSIPVSTTFYILQEKLQPGLYYWKLESEKELLFTGKFIVRK